MIYSLSKCMLAWLTGLREEYIFSYSLLSQRLFASDLEEFVQHVEFEYKLEELQ